MDAGNLTGRKRQFVRSIAVCTAELQNDPNNAGLLGRRGEAKRKLGLHESAILDFNAALAMEPASVMVLAGRGAAKRALEHHAEAVSDFNAALELQPNSAQLLIGRSATFRLLGWHPEALADLEAALQLEPQNIIGLQQRGELLRKTGEQNKALADFDSALRLDPGYAPALAGRGAVKRSLGKQAQCIMDYDMALRLEPKNAAVLAGRGGAKLDLGRYEEALSDFDRALALNPNDPYAKWGHTMAMRQDGRAPLQTITLHGFSRPEINAKFVERRQLEFTVNECETYWSESGQVFIYWCQTESRWKGTRASDLPEVQGGRNCGFVGSPVGADILAPSFCGSWFEWGGNSWELRPKAGIQTIGLLTTIPKTLVMAGFTKKEMNVEYVERRQPEFTVGGRETFWSVGGHYFLYYCKKESRWKGARSGDLLHIQNGKNLGYIGAKPGTNLFELKQGWFEWDGATWLFSANAGIVSTGPKQKEEPKKQAKRGEREANARPAKLARGGSKPSRPARREKKEPVPKPEPAAAQPAVAEPAVPEPAAAAAAVEAVAVEAPEEEAVAERPAGQTDLDAVFDEFVPAEEFVNSASPAADGAAAEPADGAAAETSGSGAAAEAEAQLEKTPELEAPDEPGADACAEG